MAVAEEPGLSNEIAASTAAEETSEAAPANEAVQTETTNDAPLSEEAVAEEENPIPERELSPYLQRVMRIRERLQEPRIRNITIAVLAAFLIAIGTGIWLWTQKTEYSVLYSGFSEKDGGQIIAALDQMSVPYKITNGGGSILVPVEMVHGLRLKFASDGLPKAGGVGFEVMENQKIGTSQFLEQVNFQRALEGELGRTIQSMDAIEHARVHLAMSKASVFVRDQQKPTASVLLTLFHGRSLDRRQVDAIVHLVASSVPGLTAANVTVVDQNGDLLSYRDREKTESEKLDAKQREYVQQLQKDIVKRVESILIPVVGEKNVRAEATVEVDFNKSEQAEEIYKPNQAPNAPSIRSQQSLESQKMMSDPNGGIPGAVTNQPPVPPTAPLIQRNPGQQQTAPPGQRVFTPVDQNNQNAPIEGKKESVINYEVDKTVRYTQKAKGEIKRMTVAVVVNYKPGKDENGKEALVPLTEAEKEEVASLVKEAMGYNPQRGDSLSVLNTRFAPLDEGVPLWKDPEVQSVAKDMAKYIIFAGIFIWLYMTILKPLVYKLSGQEEADRRKREAEEAARIKAEAIAKAEAEEAIRLRNEAAAKAEAEAAAKAAEEAAAAAETEAKAAEEAAAAEAALAEEGELADGSEAAVVSLSGVRIEDEDDPSQQLLEAARSLARENPKLVANIILEWLGND